MFLDYSENACNGEDDRMKRNEPNYLCHKAPLLRFMECEYHHICEAFTGSCLKSHQTPQGLIEVKAVKLSRRVITP